MLHFTNIGPTALYWECAVLYPGLFVQGYYRSSLRDLFSLSRS
jgi:hypothetical protein